MIYYLNQTELQTDSHHYKSNNQLAIFEGGNLFGV